jgi:hypothetical protein
MNKLHIAVKLIHLLNERKQVNSRMVAEELNVSIRTAQRYLNDLSSLPCVLSTEDSRNNQYYLSPEYKLNGALTDLPDNGKKTPSLPVSPAVVQSNGSVCLACGIRRGHLPEIASGQCRNALQQINLIVSIVRKQLGRTKCPFP